MQKNNFTRREFLKYSALSIPLLYLAGCESAYASNLIDVTQHTFNTGKLTEPIRIIHFSDLHLSKNLSEELLKDTIKILKSINPDLICFTGDIITSGKDYTGQISEVFSNFNPKLGVFTVLGNHDYADDGHSKLVKEQFNKAGVKVLINETLKVNHKNKEITISGLDDLWRGKQDLNKTLKANNKSILNICLTHNPSNIEEISNYKSDLVLAGHTHGGQIYLPNVLNHFYKSKFNPNYIRGIYRVKKSILNVNRGIGTTISSIEINKEYYKVPAVRVFSTPEISVITIT